MTRAEREQADAAEALQQVGQRRRAVLAELDQITPQVREAVLRALTAGITVRRAAVLAEVSPETVSQWRRERGGEMLRDGVDPAQVAQRLRVRLATAERWATQATDERQEQKEVSDT